MKFDNSHKPDRSNLSPVTAKMMDKVFYRRRTEGLNVQFISDSGNLDEWSFADVTRRDAFIASLEKLDKDYATSAPHGF
jgi:hypothetical protein